MKIVGYIRVSTDEQAKSGLGLEDQMKTIKETAKSIGCDFRAIVVDDGLSATCDIDKRPKLLEALSLLEKGDILLAAKRDRLSRGDPVVMAMIERLIAKKKTKIISAAGEGSGDEGPQGQLFRQILDAFARYEAAIIALRTRVALRAKRRRGELAGATPFGWDAKIDPGVSITKRGKPGSKLVAVGVEQEALAVMKELRASGKSYREIADELTNRGIKTKRGGVKWHYDSVRCILMARNLDER